MREGEGRLEQNELQNIQKIMKRIMLISVTLYALLILCLFTVFGTILSQNVKIIIMIVAPMVVGGLGLLIIKVIKGNKE